MFIFFIYLIVQVGRTSNYSLVALEKIVSDFFHLSGTHSLTSPSLPIDQIYLPMLTITAAV